MSQDEEDFDVRVEIQKLLGQINEDMNKVKIELSAVNQLIEDNASLPATAQLVNEKLKMAAKDAGIDIENLFSDGDDDEEEENMDSREASEVEKSNDEAQSAPDADAIAKVSEKVTESAKRTLRNRK